jgi:hypothetical protein
MTLEQTTQLVWSAIELEDLGALETACRERADAIRGLKSRRPSEALRDALAESIRAGEEAKRTVRLIKQRVRHESRRLDRIENGFLKALRVPATPWLDCKG